MWSAGRGGWTRPPRASPARPSLSRWPGRASLEPSANLRTRDLNDRPRSSKSRNQSKLAQAGENSTVEPGPASATAAPTASSSVAASRTCVLPFRSGRRRMRDSPIKTTPRTRSSCSRSKSGPNAMPLSRPPMMTTTRPGVCERAYSVLSGVVDFESFTKWMPRTTPACSSRCSRPRKDRITCQVSGSSRPRSRQVWSTACQFRLRARWVSGASRSAKGLARLSPNHAHRARSRSPTATMAGSVPLSTTQSSGVCRWNSRALAAT